MKKWTKAALFAATAALMLAAGTFISCSDGDDDDDGGSLFEIDGGVLTKCNNDKIPRNGVVTIPDDVTSIGESAFADCTALKSVTIPDGVTSISDYAFYGCTALTSVTIPDGVTSIGYRAFYGCSVLTSVKIGNGVTEIIKSAFEDCSALTSVTFDDTEGWYATQVKNELGESIDVSEPSKNATNFKDDKVWLDKYLYKKAAE